MRARPHFFKVFTEFCYNIVSVLVFWPGGRWDLSSSAKCTSWAGRQSLNHWTAREVLIHISIGTMLCWLAVYTQTGNRLNLTYSLPISACSLGSFQTSKAPWHLLSYLCFIITWEVQFGTIPLYYGWSSLNFYKKKKKRKKKKKLLEGIQLVHAGSKTCTS